MCLGDVNSFDAVQWEEFEYAAINDQLINYMILFSAYHGKVISYVIWNEVDGIYFCASCWKDA